MILFFFKQKTAYEMRISDWSSDVCSSDLVEVAVAAGKMRVVAVALRELPRYCQFAQRAQQRVVVEIGGDFTLHVRTEVALERPALRPLVVHLAGAFDQIGRAHV